MAVQIFDVFKVFFGNLRSKFANLGGTKNAGQGSSKVDIIWFMLTFELPKCAYFCRTEHVVAQRST